MTEVIFSKYSRGRDPRFSICTTILKDEEKKWVEKRPFTAAAKAHVNNLENTCRELTRLYKNTRLYPCPVAVEDGVARLPFIEGESFQDRLVELFQKGDKAGIIAFCQGVVDLIKNSGPTERFVKGPAFVQVFGDPDLPDELSAKSFSNVDMVFDNLVEDAYGHIAVLDYEWCFPFQIPLEFIVWRSLYFSFGKCGHIEFANEILYPVLGIPEHWIEKFWKMESAFNRNLIKKNDPDAQYPNYAAQRKHYGIQEMQEAFKAIKCHTQVFFDTGNGLSEGESKHFYHSYCVDYNLTIPVKKNIRLFRIDPSDTYAIVTLKKCCAAGKDGIFDMPYRTNGIAAGNTILFDTYDPQIWITELSERVEEVRVVLNVVKITPDMAENYRRQAYIRAQTEVKNREEREEAVNQREILRRQLAEVQNAYGEVQNAYAELQNAYGKAQNACAEVRNAYNEISNAAFWKMTKPLRTVLDFVKRLLRSN